MPLFELKCINCNKIVEVLIISKTDQLPTCCSLCSGKLEQIISNTSFRLRGTCWFKDGYSSKKQPNIKKKLQDSEDEKNDKNKKNN